MSSSAPDFVRRPSKGYAFRLSDDRQEEEDEPGDEGRNICLSLCCRASPPSFCPSRSQQPMWQMCVIPPPSSLSYARPSPPRLPEARCCERHPYHCCSILIPRSCLPPCHTPSGALPLRLACVPPTRQRTKMLFDNVAQQTRLQLAEDVVGDFCTPTHSWCNIENHTVAGARPQH
jgi:hypothetical protein